MKTARDLAETLGVSEDTVQSWFRLFGDFAPSTIVEGVTVYPDKAEEILKVIQRLDGEGKSFSEIREELARGFSVGPQIIREEPREPIDSEPAGSDVAISKPSGTGAPLSIVDPAVADAFRGIIHWMEVAEGERQRTRRVLLWLTSSVVSLMVLFVALFGWVAHLIRASGQEARQGREAVEDTRAKILASVAEYAKDIGALSQKVEAIRAASAEAAQAIKEQEARRGTESEKLDRALETIRAWSVSESGRISDILEEWQYQLAKTETRKDPGPAQTAGLPSAARNDPGKDPPKAPPTTTEDPPRTGAARPDDQAGQTPPDDTQVASTGRNVPAPTYGLTPSQKESIRRGLQSALQSDGDGEAEPVVVGPVDTQGRQAGWGTVMFPGGDKYAGEFQNGLKHGQGTYTFKNGDTYIGEYRDNKRCGHGTYVYSDGDTYVGEFQDGQRHGHGIYTYADGQKYVGQWAGGVKNGRGYFVDKDGNRTEGVWENDALLDASGKK